MPVNQYYARLLGSKRLQSHIRSPQSKENSYRNGVSPLRTSHRNRDLELSAGNISVPLFTKETHQMYMQTWDLISISERAIESIRKRLSRKTDLYLAEAFD